MPTIKKPVHVLVDELNVLHGPGAGKLGAVELRLAALRHVRSGVLEGSTDLPRVEMTLTSSASGREFTRDVSIYEISPEYDWDTDAETGRLVLKGYIGNWRFEGVYDPQTRQGVLKENEYDLKAEAERDRATILGDLALMQRGY